MLAWLLVCALITSSAPEPKTAPPTQAAPETELIWSRSGPEDSIRVTAKHPGPSLKAAQLKLQRASDHLDALRTIRPHVVWTLLEARAGRIRVEGRADSSLYAGLALATLRQIHPGYKTAGSGIQQLHNVPEGGWSWRLRVLLVPPTPRPAP